MDINNHLSNYLPVLSGVYPRGPLLFISYMNDLPQYVINSLVYMFADDAKCFRQISNPPDLAYLQRDLHQMESWKDTWNLKFNVKKSLFWLCDFLQATL